MSMRERDVILLKNRKLDDTVVLAADYSNNVNNTSPNFPPENEIGNVEYKWKLIRPSASRLHHLCTQMKWRLREGNGEALYRIGVEDNGNATGLCEADMNASLDTLFQMASTIGASIEVVEKRILRDSTDSSRRAIADVWVRKLAENNNLIDLRLALLGSADAGKSTLCGVLTQGELDNGQGKTRLNLFRHLHEFRSGKTSSVCIDFIGFMAENKLINYKEYTLEEIIERATKIITLIDLAGDQRYLKTTIYGVSGYNPHYCALLINAVAGITNITKEHIGLALALDISFFIVVTKIDLVDEAHHKGILLSIERLVQNLGKSLQLCRITTENDAELCALSMNKMDEKEIIPILSISNVTGTNIDLFSKFLSSLPQHNSEESVYLRSASTSNFGNQQFSADGNALLLFLIDDVFQMEVGVVACGIVAKGVIHEMEKIQIGPNKSGRYVKGIVESIHRNKQPVLKACAGESAALCISFSSFPRRRSTEVLKHCSQFSFVRRGMVIIGASDIGLCCRCFVAKFYLLHHSAKSHEIGVGFQGTVYIGPLCRTVAIVNIENAQSIHPNKWFNVTFKFLQQMEFVHVGTPLIFRECHTKGMGEVLRILDGEQ